MFDPVVSCGAIEFKTVTATSRRSKIVTSKLMVTRGLNKVWKHKIEALVRVGFVCLVVVAMIKHNSCNIICRFN